MTPTQTLATRIAAILASVCIATSALAQAPSGATATAVNAPAQTPSTEATAPVPNNPNDPLAGVSARIKQRYPAMKYDSIAVTEVPGLYEVVMGKNVAYVDQSAQYFLFGHLFDMPGQRDLTAMRLETLNKVEFGQLPLQDAIKVVRGNGSRVLAIFSDPDCPHCKNLEMSLIALNNVTIYTFLYPLAQLHPAARDKAVAVWCSANKAQAWENLMVRNQLGKPSGQDKCNHPIDRNIALGNKLGINGTPMIIAADGRQLPGALAADRLDAWLNQSPPKVSSNKPAEKAGLQTVSATGTGVAATRKTAP
jgi:thiol:disulfide interchange protein DsbC